MRTIAILSSIGVSASLANPPARPHDAALTDETALEAAKSASEVVGWMTEVGVDYPLLLQKARTADPRSLRLYLWLGGNIDLDGAASEGYGYDLYQIAKKVGDVAFSKALEGQPREVAEACYRYLCFEICTEEDSGTSKAATEVSLILPKTLETNMAARSML